MKTTKCFGRVVGSIPGLVVGLAVAAQAAAQTTPQAQVTFTKDIAPILQRSCQNCHRPNGGLAPMALSTYEEVRPWARAIKQRTSNREMPPWFIEKNVGIQQFKDDPSLSDAEIATIARWVDNGAPRGNPADMPPPRQFPPVGAWSSGPKPDLIVSSPTFTVKAIAADQSFALAPTPTGLTEDQYIKAFEVREFRPNQQDQTKKMPGQVDWNLYVVHHAHVGTVDEVLGADGDAGRQLNCRPQRRAVAPQRTVGVGDCLPPGRFEYTYNVGMNGFTYPPEMGITLRAGSVLYWPSFHTHSNGQEVQVQLQVGFWFHPKGYKPKYARGLARGPESLVLGGEEIDIPGGMDNVRHDSFATLPVPAKMVNFEPHLHSAGKRQCLEVIYPDFGGREMLNCAGYNHAWVRAYVYDDDVAPLLPAGTILHLISWYDNSPRNPRVLDPRNWKGEGGRSVDVMFRTSSNFLYMTEEEFQAEVAAREAKRRQTRTTEPQ